jgi:hypothetical protein
VTRKILGLGLVAMIYDNSRASPGEQLDNVLLELTGLETDLELLGQEAGEILGLSLSVPMSHRRSLDVATKIMIVLSSIVRNDRITRIVRRREGRG